jgi:membrane associated rhomboid family serine protease
MDPHVISILVAVAVALVTIAAFIPFHKELLKPALIAGVITFIMCWAMNYFVTSFPASLGEHAFGNGLSGFMGGFVGGYVSLKGMAKRMRDKSTA